MAAISDQHPVSRWWSSKTSAASSSSSSSQDHHHDSEDDDATYWLVLATHCLQQLLPLTNEQDAPVAAWLSYRIATALPRGKLDGGTATRQLVGRALLVVAAAAAQALEDCTTTTTACCCVVALDRVTLGVQPHAASAAVSTRDSYWAALQWNDNLQPDPQWLEQLRDDRDWSAADACWRALTTKQQHNNSDNDVLQAFQTLLQDQTTTFSEGRYALKRWSSVALTWYRGQEQMVRAALRLLTSDDDDDDENNNKDEDDGSLECTAVVTVAATTTANADNNDSGNNNNKKKQKSKKATTQQPQPTVVSCYCC